MGRFMQVLKFVLSVCEVHGWECDGEIDRRRMQARMSRDAAKDDDAIVLEMVWCYL